MLKVQGKVHIYEYKLYYSCYSMKDSTLPTIDRCKSICAKCQKKIKHFLEQFELCFSVNLQFTGLNN